MLKYDLERKIQAVTSYKRCDYHASVTSVLQLDAAVLVESNALETIKNYEKLTVYHLFQM